MKPALPALPALPATPGHKAHISIDTKSGHDDLKDVSVNINQNGVSLTGKNDKDEKVKVKVNEHGIRVITTDTNGKTTITKE